MVKALAPQVVTMAGTPLPLVQGMGLLATMTTPAPRVLDLTHRVLPIRPILVLTAIEVSEYPIC